MAEPSSTTAGGIAIATGVISLTGSILGLQYDALLFGLFGGLVSLMHIAAVNVLRVAGTLATAALCGALFAPVVLGLAHAYLEWTMKIPAGPARLCGAFVIGLLAQVGIPLCMDWLKSFAKSRTPGGGA